MADQPLQASAPPPPQASYGATGSSQPPPYPTPGNPPYPTNPTHPTNQPYHTTVPTTADPVPGPDGGGTIAEQPPVKSAPYPIADPPYPPANTASTTPQETQPAQNTAPSATGTAYQYPQPGQQVTTSIPSEPPPAYEPPKGPAAYPGVGYPQQPYPVQEQPGYHSGGVYPYPSQQQPILLESSEKFGACPKTMQCPTCQALVTTKVSYVSGGLTWLSAGLLCLFCCWLCFCIPFCVDGTKDVVHQCPNCNKTLGKFHRM